MFGSFAQGTFHLTGLAPLAFCLSSTVFAGWLPRPTRSPCFWWCDFRRTSGTTQPSDHFQSTASRFACAYGVAFPRCHPRTLEVLLGSRPDLPYRAVRKHLGA